ncbi:MAG TPA: EAL domain-containing protein [Acidimicrobiia bacterium]|nr:EAL domain-containing protein [Acidimicrobiia bacterium]
MGTEAGLALAAGFFAGMFVTAAMLWFHERRTRRALEEVSARVNRNEARSQALLRESCDVLALVGRDGTLKYVSPAADRMLGRSVTRFVGTQPAALVHPDDQVRLTAALDGAAAERARNLELRIQHEDGHWVLVEATVDDLRNDPVVDGIIVAFHEVGERRQLEAELREAQEQFRSTFEHAPIGMALTSLDGRFVRVNRALAQMVGRAEDQLEGASVLALTHPDDREAAHDATRRLVTGQDPNHRLEQRFVHTDGRPVWIALTASPVRDPHGHPLYLMSQIEDVTERRASGARLAHQAVHDPLTGLPNRVRFVERLQHALGSQNGSGRVAVLFVDLDHFQVINDSLGHAAGDRLLVAVADRLRAAIRPSDTLARFAGDEFTILCTGVPDEATAFELAERIAAAVAKPLALVEGEVFVTASVGIAVATGELETPEILLRSADAAMHRAKEQGRARAEIYDTNSHDQAIRHLRTGNDLHRALERSELRIHYQPILSLETGQLAGFEALLRWEHPERGLVRPDEFVSLAEETGLVVPIGSWALEEACQRAAGWHRRGAPVTISVNLSPRQLAEPSLPHVVASVLRKTQINPDKVWLEITESTLMRDAESAVTRLRALRALGVHLSVDDFGTGYSSMSYLKRFPVEALKVDRSFVDGLGREPEDSAICTAVISLAHALGLRAVAEGVETPEQLAELRTLGCEMAQGYLFGKPAPAEVYGERPDERGWSNLTHR